MTPKIPPSEAELLMSGEALREDYKLRWTLAVAEIRRLRTVCRNEANALAGMELDSPDADAIIERLLAASEGKCFT